MGIAIAFASGKGGTGKTTVAGAVAGCLGAMGKKVLCIDCDAGLRNMDIILGMSDVSVMTYADVIEGRISLEDAAIAHHELQGVYLITAPFKPDYDEQSMLGFRDMLLDARENYDYVFLDAPAGIGPGFEMACKYADKAIIIATCDRTSLRDGERTHQRLRALGVDDNCLIVNRVSRKLLKSVGATIDDAMDETALPLLGLVPEDPAVSVAAGLGKALILYRRKGASIAMLHIARRMEGIKTPIMKIK